MEMEKELSEIKGRLNNIENRLSYLQHESPTARPQWVNFLIGFLVVFVGVGGVIIISGLIVFFRW